MVLSILSPYIFPLIIKFVISILRVWYLQKEWFILFILLWLPIPKSNRIQTSKFILFKMISQQKMLNCQKNYNKSMVKKTSIIVARKKPIHSVVTFNIPMHTINIMIDRCDWPFIKIYHKTYRITVFEIFKKI
jgi:hypothetical protein